MMAKDHLYFPAADRRLRPGQAVLGLLPVVLSFFLSSCINIVPLPRVGESREALALGRVLKSLRPQASEQLQTEHTVAQELKVTLEEASQLQPEIFAQKFNGYVDQLIAIRNRRRQISDAIRQNSFNSPMVFAIQQDALNMLGHEVERTQTWIVLAQNVRLRAELRSNAPEADRKKGFPELPQLNHELDTFLAETGEDPLGNQLKSLQMEYRSINIFGADE